ncbi:MAG: molybdopterin molybdotransferase MoeA, partial [Acetobacteraceae bacterium]|nr:molybdopterin molybdotransferase MoeA [Acetobacteraceae bacterium]
VPLADGWGRVLAEPVVARLSNPPADVSAMDGYALRAMDGALGARLRVIGEAPAGHPFAGRAGPGDAVRLYTGSVLPEGTDSVLLQEDAARDGDHVEIREAINAGRHVRPCGQDFAAGDVVLPAGQRLGARALGLAAAANQPWLVVRRRPAVALLATGDEIALPGETVPPGSVVSSNTHALAAMVRAGGGLPLLLPIARDDRAALAAAVAGARGADFLVTTGGASVGDYDLVQAALGDEGFELDFWKVAMRPGKPLVSGRLGEMPVLGLPGNPVSALVCGMLFLVPALARLSGLPGEPPTPVQARLGAAVAANDGRTDHLRASLREAADGTLVATPFPKQDSAMLRAFAEADALVLRAPYAPALPAGAAISVLRLDTFGL